MQSARLRFCGSSSSFCFMPTRNLIWSIWTHMHRGLVLIQCSYGFESPSPPCIIDQVQDTGDRPLTSRCTYEMKKGKSTEKRGTNQSIGRPNTRSTVGIPSVPFSISHCESTRLSCCRRNTTVSRSKGRQRGTEAERH